MYSQSFQDVFQTLNRIANRVSCFVEHRVGMELPRIEIRFQNLSVEGEAYVGTRALPTLLNTTLNAVEVIL